jgi:hypothetical protein
MIIDSFETPVILRFSAGWGHRPAVGFMRETVVATVHGVDDRLLEETYDCR